MRETFSNKGKTTNKVNQVRPSLLSLQNPLKTVTIIKVRAVPRIVIVTSNQTIKVRILVASRTTATIQMVKIIRPVTAVSRRTIINRLTTVSQTTVANRLIAVNQLTVDSQTTVHSLITITVPSRTIIATASQSSNHSQSNDNSNNANRGGSGRFGGSLNNGNSRNSNSRNSRNNRNNNRRRNNFTESTARRISGSRKPITKGAPERRTRHYQKLWFTKVGMNAQDLGKILHREPSEIIRSYFMLGVMANQNQSLDKDTIEILAADYGIEAQEKVEVDVADIDKTLKKNPTIRITLKLGHRLSLSWVTLIMVRPPCWTIYVILISRLVKLVGSPRLLTN